MTKHPSILYSAVFSLLFLSGCNKSTDSTNDATKHNKLTVTEQCKPVENKCEIFGEKIKLKLQFKAAPSYQRLLPVILESFDSTLESAFITMIIDGEETPAIEMKSSNAKKWEAQLMTFAKIKKDNIKIRLLISYNKKLYSAEFPILY